MTAFNLSVRFFIDIPFSPYFPRTRSQTLPPSQNIIPNEIISE